MERTDAGRPLTAAVQTDRMRIRPDLAQSVCWAVVGGWSRGLREAGAGEAARRAPFAGLGVQEAGDLARLLWGQPGSGAICSAPQSAGVTSRMCWVSSQRWPSGSAADASRKPPG